MFVRVQQAVTDKENMYGALVDAVRVCSLGQFANLLFEVGQYRRSV